MTQQEILEYNKRCVEFLGWRKTHPNIKNWHIYITLIGSISYDKMLFHSDWNWIMEVVEKIQTLDKLGGIVMIQQGRCRITSRMAGDNTVYADVSYYYLHGMRKQKEAVVQAIHQYLIWYNNELKKQ